MASTLVEMCQRSAMLNVDDIRDVGDCPYRLLRPILKKVSRPGQLAEIEKVSPQIAEEDAELWQAFIRRDIPQADKKIQANTPGNPTKWGKVYIKLKRADQKQQDAAEEQLKAALSGKKEEKARNQTQIIHAVIPQAKKPVWGAPRAAPSGSQALKNARTTQDQLKILRRQTANRQQGRTLCLSTPSHQLQQQRGVVQQAPRSMVNQYSRIQPQIQQPKVAQPSSRPAIFAPRQGPISDRDRAINLALSKEREGHEARLRALTGRPSTSKSAAPSLSSSPPQKPVSHPTASQSSTSSQAAAPKPQRKRPAYDPFMPAKKRNA